MISAAPPREAAAAAEEEEEAAVEEEEAAVVVVEAAGDKFNMLLPSIKDEQLQNILSNKYLNSSVRG